LSWNCEEFSHYTSDDDVDEVENNLMVPEGKVLIGFVRNLTKKRNLIKALQLVFWTPPKFDFDKLEK